MPAIADEKNVIIRTPARVTISHFVNTDRCLNSSGVTLGTVVSALAHKGCVVVLIVMDPMKNKLVLFDSTANRTHLFFHNVSHPPCATRVPELCRHYRSTAAVLICCCSNGATLHE